MVPDEFGAARGPEGRSIPAPTGGGGSAKRATVFRAEALGKYGEPRDPDIRLLHVPAATQEAGHPRRPQLRLGQRVTGAVCRPAAPPDMPSRCSGDVRPTASVCLASTASDTPM